MNRGDRAVVKEGDEWFFIDGPSKALAKFDVASKRKIFLSEAAKLSCNKWIELKASDISSDVYRDFATTCLKKFRDKEVTIDSYSKIGDYKFRLHEYIQGELQFCVSFRSFRK